MKLSIARIENINPTTPPCPTDDRAMNQKAAKARHPAGKARALAVEHVEQIRDDQNDASQKNLPNPNSNPDPTVNSNANKGENVRANVTARQPTHIASMIRCPPRNTRSNIL